MTKTIVLVGGSFHGKSLIALQIAQNFKIPSIICTDSVRNMLNVTYPNRPYLSTSTYRLSSTELNKQFKHVSNVLRQMMPIYEKRGESTVLEGMHFSPEFLDYLSSQTNTFIFGIDNTLSIIKRLQYKSLTRSRATYYNQETNRITTGPFTKDKIHKTAYLKHATRIEEIHKQIMKYFTRHKLPIIKFNSIEVATQKITALIKNLIKS